MTKKEYDFTSGFSQSVAAELQRWDHIRTDEKFYCIDAEGNGDGTTDEFWNYTTGWTYSSPAVYDGKVFIASQSGILYCFRDNEAPAIPSQPSGSVEGEIGLDYTYSTDTTDPEGDDIEYLFDWGDGTDSGWIDTSSRRRCSACPSPILKRHVIVESTSSIFMFNSLDFAL